MHYLALIYSEERDPATIPPEEMGQIMASYNRFTEEAREAGVSTVGEALWPTSTATTLRLQNGQLVTTDGPFAETREALGGFYLLDCKDLDEAIAWARRIPALGFGGTIEVRPIVEFSADELAMGQEAVTAGG
jgi:hypothetical protein